MYWCIKYFSPTLIRTSNKSITLQIKKLKYRENTGFVSDHNTSVSYQGQNWVETPTVQQESPDH